MCVPTQSTCAPSRMVAMRGAIGAIRIDRFAGREHVVVPVVAMVEGVIRASNAPGPELVRAEVIAKAPAGWNGRPVFQNHPSVNGVLVSGNDPRVLESGAYGVVFNATSPLSVLKKRQLTFEAWLDPERARRVPGAARALERIRNGEPVEISIGAFTTVAPVPGNFNGVAYGGEWVDVVPDHLAILSEGATGACSVEMGCGIRAAAASFEDAVRAVAAAMPMPVPRIERVPPPPDFVAAVIAAKGAKP